MLKELFTRALLILLISFISIEATHFRYGTISYTYSSPTDWNVITFRVQTAWRRSYGPLTPANPTVGQSVIIDNSYTFNFGDGNSTPFVGLKVTSINTQDDWVVTSWSYTYTYPKAPGNYTAYHTGNNRISTLKNNKDQPWNIQANVIINGLKPNNSPASAALPIVAVLSNTINTYQIPAVDADGDQISFRDATQPENLGTGTSWTPCPQLTISPSGLVTFNTTGLAPGFYQTQHQVMDNRGASVPVDYIIQIIGGTCTRPCSSGSQGSANDRVLFIMNEALSQLPSSFTLSQLKSTAKTVFDKYNYGASAQAINNYIDAIANGNGPQGVIAYINAVYPPAQTCNNDGDCACPSGYVQLVPADNLGQQNGPVLDAAIAANGNKAYCVKSSPLIVSNGTTDETTTPSTPPPGTLFKVNVGATLTFPVIGDDPIQPKFPVALIASGLPSGADFTQTNCSRGGCACTSNNCGAPVFGQVRWTPTQSDKGQYAVCFGCYQAGLAYSIGQHCLNIQVVPPLCNTGTLKPSCSASSSDPARCCNCAPGYNATTACLACTDNYYGANCDPCPNCNNGVCNSGITGPGTCTCNPGWVGQFCNISTATCNPDQKSYIYSVQSIGSAVVNPRVTTIYIGYADTSLTVPMVYTAPKSTYYYDVVLVIDATLSTSDLTDVATYFANFANANPGVATAVVQITNDASKFKLVNTLTTASSTSQTSINNIAGNRVTNGVSNNPALTPALNTIAGFSVTDIGWRQDTYRTILVFAKTDTTTYPDTIVNSASDGQAISIANVYKQRAYTTSTSRPYLSWHAVVTMPDQQQTGAPLAGLFLDSQGMFSSSSAGVINLAWSNNLVRNKVAIPTMTTSLAGWGTGQLNVKYNTVPSSNPINLNINQNTPSVLTIYTSDDNTVVKVRFTSLPNNMTISSNGKPVTTTDFYSTSSNFSIITDRYYFATSTFNFLVNDGCESSATYLATITVTHFNNPPNAVNGTYNMKQMDRLPFSFTALVSDPDNDTPLSAQILSIDPSSSSLLVNNKPLTVGSIVKTTDSLTFVPNARFSGPATISFIGLDTTNTQSNVAYVNINVAFVNTAPTLSGPGNAVCSLGQTCSISYNVYDPDNGDIQRFKIVTNTLSSNTFVTNAQVSSGTTTAALPAAGINALTNVAPVATVTVTFTVSSNATANLGSISVQSLDSNTGTSSVVTTTITAPNTPPVILSVNPPTLSVTEQNNVTITVVANDQDGDQGSHLTFAITLPATGTVFYGGSNAVVQRSGTFPVSELTATSSTPGQSSYTFLYSPPLYFNGSVNIPVTMTDPVGGSVQQILTIVVPFTNHPPVTSPPGGRVCPIGLNCTMRLFVNDPDRGDTSTLFLYDFNVINSAGVSNVYYQNQDMPAPVEISFANATLTSSALQSFYTDVTLTLTDLASGNLATFTLQAFDTGMNYSNALPVPFLAGPNNAPTHVNPTDSVSVPTESSVTISATGTDQDGGQGGKLQIVIDQIPTRGQLSANGVALAVGSTVTWTSSTDSTSTFSLTYAPAKYYNGTYSFTYHLVDVLGLASTQQTTRLVVAFVNHQPAVSTTSTTVLCLLSSRNCTFSLNVQDPDLYDFETLFLAGNTMGSNITNMYIVSNGNTRTVAYTNAATQNSQMVNGLLPVSSVNVILTRAVGSVGDLGSLTFAVVDLSLNRSLPLTVAVQTSLNNPPVLQYFAPNPIVLDESPANKTISLAGNDPDGNLQATTLRFVVTKLPTLGKLYKTDDTEVVVNAVFDTSFRSTDSSSSYSVYEVKYLPAPYNNGGDAFSVVFIDESGSSSDVNSVPITITPVNHNPSISTVNNKVVCALGAVCRIPVSVSDPDHNDNVYVNMTSWSLTTVDTLSTDYDAKHTDLTVPPTFGFVTPASAGSQASGYINVAVNSYANGILGSFVVVATDKGGLSSAELSIQITAGASNPPFLIVQTPANVVPVPGDSSVVVSVTGSDMDGSQGNNLTLVIYTAPTNGYMVSRKGVKVPATISGSFAFNADERTADNSVSPPTSNFGFTYVANKLYNGSDSITFAFVDGLGQASELYTTKLEVAFVNHLPVLSTPQPIVVCGFFANCTATVNINDPDVGDLQSVTLVYGLTHVTNFFVTYTTDVNALPMQSGTAKTGVAPQSTLVFTFTTDSLIVGSLGSLTFVSTDSYGNSSLPLTIQVQAAQNKMPTAVSPDLAVPVICQEDSEVNVMLFGTDPDGEQGANLDFRIATYPADGKLYDQNGNLLSGNGLLNSGLKVSNISGLTTGFNLTYVPRQLFHDIDTFSFVFVDPLTLESTTYVLTINVTHVNHPPTGSGWVASGLSGKPLQLPSFSGSDVDGDTLTLAILNIPASNASGLLLDYNGQAVDASYINKSLPFDQWKFTYVTDVLSSGAPLFTLKFRFSDGLTYSPVYTGEISIKQSSYPPSASPVNVTLAANTLASFKLNVSSITDELSTLTVTIVTAPKGQLYLDAAATQPITTSTIFVDASRTLYYSPPKGAYSFPYGSVFSQFTYQVTNPAQQKSEVSFGLFFVEFVNLAPVPTFVQLWVVNQEQTTRFVLTATDDHTLPADLAYSVFVPADFEGTFVYVDEDQKQIALVKGNTTIIPTEVSELLYTGPYNRWNPNFANFTVTVTDDDLTNPLKTTVTVIIDVEHLNKPPVLTPGPVSFSIYYNQTSTLTWNATDVDSPLDTLRGVLNYPPLKGSLYECIYNANNDSCSRGDLVVQTASSTIFINQTSVGVFRIVFVPDFGTSGKVYAVPSFIVIDDYLAPSELAYLPSIRVKTINQPPVLTVGGPFSVVQGSSVSISNGTTFDDPDAGSIPINMVIRYVGDSAVDLHINTTAAFTPSRKTNVANCFYNEDFTVVNCTATKVILRSYVSFLRFNSKSTLPTGNHTVEITIDDLGAGAEAEDAVSSRRSVTGTITVEVTGLAAIPIARSNNNLTAAIAAGSVGGALGAAAAVGLVAKLIKKPDESQFANMLDFDGAGVLDNPLYVANNAEVVNPLYDDTA